MPEQASDASGLHLYPDLLNRIEFPPVLHIVINDGLQLIGYGLRVFRTKHARLDATDEGYRVIIIG